MMILKITLVVLGLAFLLFGYFIYSQKKHYLINGFKAEYEAGRKDERYARRFGRIEFASGVASLVSGIVLFLFI